MSKQALIKSILHWVDNCEANKPEEASISSSDCALCETYYKSLADNPCEYCPIYKDTEEPTCLNTPYEDAEDVWEDWRFYETKKYKKKFRKAAFEEVRYLISLLEKELEKDE